MNEAHEPHHRSAKDILWRSRSSAWIVQGRALVMKIKKASFYLTYSTNSSQFNLTQIVEEDARKATLWEIRPTASQWQNGLAELGVKAFKKTVAKVTSGN